MFDQTDQFGRSVWVELSGGQLTSLPFSMKDGGPHIPGRVQNEALFEVLPHKTDSADVRQCR